MNDSRTNADSVLRPHYKRLAHGVASYVPPLYAALLRSAAFFRREEAQEPQTSPRMHEMSAAYCYNVWLRHLVYAHMAGLDARPETVVELGPGRSLGVGAAALISGSGRLHAVEPYDQPSIAANLAIFDELVGMFRRREPAIPYSASGRRLSPAPREFPYHILDEARLGKALEKSRLNAIRDSIGRATGDGRRATGDGRRATGDGRRATGDGRRATGDIISQRISMRHSLAERKQRRHGFLSTYAGAHRRPRQPLPRHSLLVETRRAHGAYN